MLQVTFFPARTRPVPESRARVAPLMRDFRRMPSNRRGAVLVEFAIILVVFLLIMISIFELSRAFNIWQVVVNCAREGARIVALPPGTQSNQALVDERIEEYLTSNNLDLALSDWETVGIDSPPGTMGQVTVNYDYTFTTLGGIMQLVGGDDVGTITLTSTSRMRNE